MFRRKILGITNRRSKSAGGVETDLLEVVDIHAHLIPAVDDGPEDLSTVLAMLTAAYREGTRIVTATPHMYMEIFKNVDPDEIVRRFAWLREALAGCAASKENAFLKNMMVLLGSENYVSPGFFDALTAKRMLTLNESRYLLLEFPVFLGLDQYQVALNRILDQGYIPVMAHPERYIAFQSKPDGLAKLRDMGCVIQVNGQSLLGNRRRPEVKTVFEILDKGLAHVISSDGHGVETRPLTPGKTLALLEKRYPKSKIRRWMSDNPRRIVQDQDLP